MTDHPALFDLETSTPRTVEAAPTVGGLPPHVRAHLDAIGQLNADGINLTVRARRCDQCRAEVLVGLDGPVAARTAIADAIEVDEVGEALAIATRRARWWLGRFANSSRQLTYQFVPRWLENIGKPFRGPVFIEHRCHAPPPPAAHSRFRIDQRHRRYGDTPDF